MKYDINFPNNPFDKEACDRLLYRELRKQILENIRLKRMIDDLTKEDDIPSAYFVIDKVIFNPPATIVFWKDGTKTVVKCKEGEEFSEWAGIALCLAKKLYGPNFHKIFKRHCSDPEKTVNDMSDSEITKAARQATKGMHEASEQSKYLFEEFLNELERNFPWTNAK